ncbi:AraC family transcriptional regulator [Rufibacter psychrotolerans]|uniref:AraC family transcriptional regulator n=1 Tax=Rufibacter psychrotolerans TaxID=2812556 RepID=UPI0019689517|nr:helix-turn-helix domain-containing protein [Rufibacter sp. SYSU D00308]
MSKQILILPSIAELYKELGISVPLTDYFDGKLLEEETGTLKPEVPTYRNNFYQIVLLTSGAAEVRVNDTTHQLRQNSFFLTGPGDALSCRLQEQPKGFLLVFNEGFMSLNVQRQEGYDAMALFETNCGFHLSLEPSKSSFFAFLGSQIMEEQKFLHLRSFDLIRSYITILLINARRLAEQEGIPLYVQEGGASLVWKFKRAISEHLIALAEGRSQRLKLVGEFAEELHVHANYLNALVKRHTGTTASNLVRQRVAQEALTLLRQSELTVQEVATRLGFDTLAHFSSFFKKMTQLSPSDYRKLLKR